MKSVLGFIRVCGVFTTILLGVISLAILYPFAGRRNAHRVFMALRWVLLWIVGVKVRGPRFDKIGPGILMANHRSYLDVLFVPTSDLFTIVGKAEVKSWPLIGWAAKALGVLWVKRESKESRTKTRDNIIAAIKGGQTVVLFPEGTSWEGPQMLPLKPAMFYESAKHGFDIYQWSLHFDSAKTGFPIGINFISHLWAVCCETKINAYVDVRAVPITHTDGDVLIADAQEWWKQSLLGLSEAHPARDCGYWPDDRLKIQA
jgi:1-acyl-sn-glycerol-3-phosphate acyltransferase